MRIATDHVCFGPPNIFTEFRSRLKRIGTGGGSPLRSLFTPELMGSEMRSYSFSGADRCLEFIAQTHPNHMDIKIAIRKNNRKGGWVIYRSGEIVVEAVEQVLSPGDPVAGEHVLIATTDHPS